MLIISIIFISNNNNNNNNKISTCSCKLRPWCAIVKTKVELELQNKGAYISVLMFVLEKIENPHL